MSWQGYLLLFVAVLVSSTTVVMGNRAYNVRTTPGCRSALINGVIMVALLICFPAWRHGLMSIGIPNSWSWVAAITGSLLALWLTMLWRDALRDGLFNDEPMLIAVRLACLALCIAGFYGYAWVAFGQATS